MKRQKRKYTRREKPEAEIETVDENKPQPMEFRARCPHCQQVGTANGTWKRIVGGQQRIDRYRKCIPCYTKHIAAGDTEEMATRKATYRTIQLPERIAR